MSGAGSHERVYIERRSEGRLEVAESIVRAGVKGMGRSDR